MPGHRIPGCARPGGAGLPTKWGGSAVADAYAPGAPLTGRDSRYAWHETAANADASVRNNPEKLSPMTFSLNQTHYQPCGTMEKT